MVPTSETPTRVSDFVPDCAEILNLSSRYGQHFESLNKSEKYALIAALAIEAGSWASGNPFAPFLPTVVAAMGAQVDPENRDHMHSIDLLQSELDRLQHIAGNIQEIDESQQQRLICALAAQLVAGYFKPDPIR